MQNSPYYTTFQAVWQQQEKSPVTKCRDPI